MNDDQDTCDKCYGSPWLLDSTSTRVPSFSGEVGRKTMMSAAPSNGGCVRLDLTVIDGEALSDCG